METTDKKQLSDMTLAELANICAADHTVAGKQMSYALVPYQQALAEMYFHDPKGNMYGYDPADHIVRYFLGNATTWRGETARNVKAELKKRL
jgi:hypothetical protein